MSQQNSSHLEHHVHAAKTNTCWARANSVDKDRILHIAITANSAWNILNFRRSLVQALLSDGHKVTVIAPEDSAVPVLTALGCRFIALTMDLKGLNPFRSFGLFFRLRNAFVESSSDVVLSFTIKNNIIGAFAAKSLRIPILPNVTGLGTAFLSSKSIQKVAEWLYRIAFNSLPVVFFQNPEDRDLFIKRNLIKSNQANVLPGSGIDLNYFTYSEYPSDDGSPVFLMIARLLRDKGVVEFVEAASKVRKCYPKARFQLLGAADSMNRTAIDLPTVKSWEQFYGVEYLGTSNDIRQEISKAHCVVLPSYREGAPRALIEAAAMARPLIATDVPGCRSVVVDGDTGLLCAPRSSESLATACLKFLSLPFERRKAMGIAGRAKMEREFDHAIVISSYRAALTAITKRF